jgi:hypothetical protein
MGLIAILCACHDITRSAFARRLSHVDWRGLAALAWLVLMLPVFVWTGLAMLVGGGLLVAILVAVTAAKWLRRQAAQRPG